MCHRNAIPVSDTIFYFRVPERVILNLFFDVFRQLEDLIDFLSVREFIITIYTHYLLIRLKY